MEEKRNNRSHFKILNGKFVAKKSFETELDAVTMARYLNSRDNVIHKMVAYKCRECGKWHIGRNNTELTEDDRQHYKVMLNKNKIFGI